jgi:hypothetical protein
MAESPYLRAEWRPWRIFCSLHEVRLLTCRMDVIKGTVSDTSVIEQIDDFTTSILQIGTRAIIGDCLFCSPCSTECNAPWPLSPT